VSIQVALVLARLARLFDTRTWTARTWLAIGTVLVSGAVIGLLHARVPQRLTSFAWNAPRDARHWFSCNGSSEGSPSWSPDGKRVVFAMRGACDAELYVVDRDGSGLHRLAQSRSGDEYPRGRPMDA
jgi:WD40-like Beta Propeller Repeat